MIHRILTENERNSNVHLGFFLLGSKTKTSKDVRMYRKLIMAVK